MSSIPNTSSGARAIRVLLCVLAGLAIVAVLVATRLVSAGSIHQGQDTLRAVAALHGTVPASVQGVALPEAFKDAIPPLPGDYEVQGWASVSVLGVDAVQLALHRRAQNERASLCMWPKTKAFASLRSSSRDVEGVRVDLWSDADHVFALARDLQP